MKINRKRKTGFARTKKYPLLNHPAFYVRKNQDDIEYITFTHSDVVDFGNKKVETHKLNLNINKKSIKEKGRHSYVVPRVYVGKRSSLHKEEKNFKLDASDKNLIKNIFSTSKRYPVPYTSNSKKKR